MRSMVLTRRARMRGATMLEALVSASIATGVMAAALGAYVRGTRGFYQEQSQAYVQSRARTALDEIAKDTRAARAFAGALTVNGVSYTASDGSAGAGCLVLLVPAQDKTNMSLIYQNGSQGSTLVLDKVVYYVNSADKTLRRTVEPAAPVTVGGVTRTSFRASVTAAVMASNVTGLDLKFRDRDGVVTTQAGRVAAVDITATLAQTSIGVPASAVAITGVRLRNMRSGTIQGTVTRSSAPVSGATVEAVFGSDSGAYTTGTVVASATTAADGTFEVFGLDPGTYSLQITSGGTTTRDGFVVPDEDACVAGTIAIP